MWVAVRGGLRVLWFQEQRLIDVVYITVSFIVMWSYFIELLVDPNSISNWTLLTTFTNFFVVFLKEAKRLGLCLADQDFQIQVNTLAVKNEFMKWRSGPLLLTSRCGFPSSRLKFRLAFHPAVSSVLWHCRLLCILLTHFFFSVLLLWPHPLPAVPILPPNTHQDKQVKTVRTTTSLTLAYQSWETGEKYLV